MTVVWLSFFAGLLLVQYLTLIVMLKSNWKNHFRKVDHFPKVSILIAARNEEEDLPRLLASLSQLDYPQDKLQILIADDQSNDRTASLVEAWAQVRPNRSLISIREDQGGRFQKNGKANALAIIGQEATGDFLFFTDADCEVPTNWLKEGVGCFAGNTGLVIGITQVKSASIFAKMQELEWWNTLGIVKVVTDLNLPTTGLGNNMVISRAAYLASGGFESLPYSVTEDLEISRALRKAGFGIRHQVSPYFLVKTKAEKEWISFLKQRKRWVTGASTLPFLWKVLLALQFLFFPLVVSLIVFDWQVGLGLWTLKIGSQSLFLSCFARKVGQKLGLLALVFFDFYQIQSLSLTILYYFWPSQVIWKSRNYP